MDLKSKSELALKWIQPIVLSGTILWAGGSAYSDLQTVKHKVERTDILEVRVAELTQSLNASNENQKAIGQNVKDLSGSVALLAQNVANLQGQMAQQNRNHK